MKYFDYINITFAALLERLGGHDMLELMINAKNFEHIHHGGTGLKFTFNVPQDNKPRLVQFIPITAPSQGDSSYPLFPTYQLRLVLEKSNGHSFELEKPFHSIVVSNPTRLRRVFEVMTKLSTNF